MGKSAANKRSIMLDGHKTSISLEDAFWTGLKEIARFQGVTVSSLVAAIAATRKERNVSSAIRTFVLENKNKRMRPPRSTRAIVSSDESQTAQAWRGFARRA